MVTTIGDPQPYSVLKRTSTLRGAKITLREAVRTKHSCLMR